MLRALALAAALLFAPLAVAQSTCPTSDRLDFWLGSWTLTWPGGQGGTPEGEQGRGTNEITRALDGCVIRERFSSEAGYVGESVSVHTPRGWRQTWVDNQGGYLVFSEGPGDGPLELRTAPVEDQGQTVVSRMTWRPLTKDVLDWYWQRSADGGATWTDVWTIRYTRREATP